MKAEEDRGKTPLIRVVPVVITLVGIIIASVCLFEEARAVDPPVGKCLIIVSSYGGHYQNELYKARSFHEYIDDSYSEEVVICLTDPTDPYSDGPANVSNVYEAFQWLINNSIPSEEVIIYISDHEKRILNETYFLFEDGNISSLMIDSWLDQVQCSEMTVILNGERSGLAGPDLADPSRDVICSMGSDQEYNPDTFNITRSLEDPTADQNNDGIVDYIEAYRKEVERLQGSGQDPFIYHI
jgi:hypothetical protein